MVCRGTVTACFALIALVAWKRCSVSTLRKLSVHPKYGWNGTVSRVLTLIALVAMGGFSHSLQVTWQAAYRPPCPHNLTIVASWPQITIALPLARARGGENGVFWQTVILLGWHPPFSSFSSMPGVQGAKSLVFVGGMQYRNFRQFSSKPPVFGRGQNDRFPKRPFRQPWRALPRNSCLAVPMPCSDF